MSRFWRPLFGLRRAQPELGGNRRLRGGARRFPAAVYMSVVRAAASAVQFGADAALTGVSFGGALGVPDDGEVGGAAYPRAIASG